MAGRRAGARAFVIASVATLVVAVVGFIVTLILNAFVLDKFDAYGEVPIPGSSSLHLPAGEMTVSFHTMVTGSGGSGLPVPPLGLTIVPPEGVPKPTVTENYGTTTTVNNDARVRVWVVQVPADGTYEITTDGKVNGYINPQLAFGHGSSYGWLVWVFVGLFVLGLVELALAIAWSARQRRAPVAVYGQPSHDQPTYGQPMFGAPIDLGGGTPVADPYTPSDEGVRIQALKNLAALRDSGALTEDEFQAEKRRLLNS